MEDETENMSEDFVLSWNKPSLRLYEAEEMAVRRRLLRPEQYHGSLETLSLSRLDPKTYILMRFFDTVKGFHEGSLDLTGRHEERYKPLINRWNRFVVDFTRLKVCVTASQLEGQNWDGLWQQFRDKWCVPDLGMWCYEKLWIRINDVFRVVSENPVPKFQKLCLLNMPVELLEQIFASATLQNAKMLSSTCHRLREIGKRYIIYYRELGLKAEPDVNRLETDHSDYEYLYNTALDSGKDMLHSIDFLCTRKDLVESLTELRIWNGWSSVASPVAGFFIAFSDTEFHAPILQGIEQILTCTTNLTTLRISGFPITSNFFEVTHCLRALYTIWFDCLDIFPPTVSSISNGIVSYSESVLNVYVSPSNVYTGGSIWVILLVYPRLRTLSVGGLYPASILAPQNQHRFNALETLERLCMTNVQDIALWINSTSRKTDLKLTHLKLRSAWSTTDHEIFTLLESLRRAPHLRVFVLDGIDNVRPQIIDHISEVAPILEGLTLVKRHSNNQLETKMCPWPGTSWEYASHFRGFSRLRHYGWNAQVPLWDFTPSIMEYFEQGFPDLADEEEPREMYFNDEFLLAGPFAANCPTLCSFTIVVNEHHSVLRTFSRTNGGGIHKPEEDFALDQSKLSQWDPSPKDMGWPLILPG